MSSMKKDVVEGECGVAWGGSRFRFRGSGKFFLGGDV